MAWTQHLKYKFSFVHKNDSCHTSDNLSQSIIWLFCFTCRNVNILNGNWNILLMLVYHTVCDKICRVRVFPFNYPSKKNFGIKRLSFNIVHRKLPNNYPRTLNLSNLHTHKNIANTNPIVWSFEWKIEMVKLAEIRFGSKREQIKR